MAVEELHGDLAELVGRLDLRPVPAAREHMQLRLRDQLERDHGAVERVDPVLAAPGEQCVMTQPVRLAPQHPVLGRLRVPERHAHRAHRVLRAGRGRVGEPLLDELVGDQLLVDHHRRDEGAQRLPRRVGAEVHQPLDALGRVGVEQVERQPARAHHDQPADPVGVGQRQPHRRTAAEAVAEQVHLLDAELVEQRDHGVGGEPVVVADDGRLVGPAEAGLVDEQRAVVRGEARQGGAEVRPRRRAGAAAVQHDQRESRASPRPCDSTSLVVLQRDLAGRLGLHLGGTAGALLASSHPQSARSVHPRVDLVPELLGAVHLERPLGVVGGVHPAGVRVAPRPLEVGALGERTAAGRLEQASRSPRWRGRCRAPGRAGRGAAARAGWSRRGRRGPAPRGCCSSAAPTRRRSRTRNARSAPRRTGRGRPSHRGRPPAPASAASRRARRTRPWPCR